MASFIDLDSTNRDRKTYPNPSFYTVDTEHVRGWSKYHATVSPLPRNSNLNPYTSFATVRIKSLITPYTNALSSIPRVFVEFKCLTVKDIVGLRTMGGKHPDDNFVCDFGRIQTDNLGTPIWIHWICNMEQVMRFDLNSQVKIRISTPDDIVLPSVDSIAPIAPIVNAQTHATFEITPYIRDGDYSNHLAQPFGN